MEYRLFKNPCLYKTDFDLLIVPNELQKTFLSLGRAIYNAASSRIILIQIVSNVSINQSDAENFKIIVQDLYQSAHTGMANLSSWRLEFENKRTVFLSLLAKRPVTNPLA